MPKAYTQEQVIEDMRKIVSESGVRGTARRLGVSAAYISDILNRKRGVSEAIAAAFGYEREIVTQVIFRKKAA